MPRMPLYILRSVAAVHRGRGAQSPGAAGADDVHREPEVLEERHDLEGGPARVCAVNTSPRALRSNSIGVQPRRRRRQSDRRWTRGRTSSSAELGCQHPAPSRRLYSDLRSSTRSWDSAAAQLQVHDPVVVAHDVEQGLEAPIVAKAALLDLLRLPERPERKSAHARSGERSAWREKSIPISSALWRFQPGR